MFEYSEAEKKLIAKISSHWEKVITLTNINPPNLYCIMAKEAFIENRQGPEFEALRRVCKACEKCNPYRRTPEFDKLCEFEEKEIGMPLSMYKSELEKLQQIIDKENKFRQDVLIASEGIYMNVDWNNYLHQRKKYLELLIENLSN